MKSRGRGSLDAPLFFSTALPTRKIAEFKAGQTIISQGEECTDVHYIDEGIVKLTSVSNRGRGAVLGILGSGDFFGESCITGQSVYLTSAVALVTSTVSIIKRKAMVRLVEEDPSVSMRFINYLLLRNQRMEQNLMDHLFNSSEKRLARTLLLLARSGEEGKLPPIFEQDQPGHAGGNGGHNPLADQFFHEQIPQAGIHPLQRWIEGAQLPCSCA